MISKLEGITNRPSYQRASTALERAKSTLLDHEKLVIYNLTTLPDSNGEVDIDPSAWSMNQSAIRSSRAETILQVIQESVKSAIMLTDFTISSDPPYKTSNTPQKTLDDPQQRRKQKEKKQPRISHSNRVGRATAYTPPSVVHIAFVKDNPDSLAEKLLKKMHPSHLQVAHICNGQCDCICHGGSNTKSPDFAIGALGPLSIYYKGPSPVNACVSRGCNEGFLKLFLAFPPLAFKLVRGSHDHFKSAWHYYFQQERQVCS